MRSVQSQYTEALWLRPEELSPGGKPPPVDNYEFDFVPPLPRWDPLRPKILAGLTEVPFRWDSPNDLPPEPSDDAAVSDDSQELSLQVEWWNARLHWKDAIAARLHEAGEHDLAAPFDKCRSEASVRRCTSCGKQTVFWNRCDHTACPCCAPRLAREKKESVEQWARMIGQPKHVVLTVRNSEKISKDYVREFKEDFNRLRRTSFATKHNKWLDTETLVDGKPRERYSYPWLGGFYALEVTKDLKGWHLHLHALVDSKFIDAVELGRVWARIRGQDIAIVKVKDARCGEYLQELLKYVVKGDTMARWSGPDIAQLLRAFKGVNTFSCFGTLYKRRGEMQAWLDERQLDPITCDCGCQNFQILSPKEAEWHELTSGIAPPPSGHHKSAEDQRFLALKSDFRRKPSIT